LNINIFAGYFSNLNTYYEVFKEGIEENKSEIIKHKLNTLFNYIDEKTSVELFKKEMKEYNDNNILLKEITNAYNEIYSNEERNSKMEEKHKEIDEINSKIEKLLNEYRKTGNHEILNQAIRSHIDELLPATRSLGYLIFELSEIEILKKSKDNIYNLIQKPNRIQKIDYTFNEPAKVIKFITK